MNRYCYSIMLVASFILGLVVPVFGQGDAGKASPSGVVGMAIEYLDSGKILIRHIEKGTPAEQAGLQIDDEILSIDGTDAAQFKSKEEAGGKVRGRAGTSVQLKIKRKEEEKTVTVLRASADDLARKHIVRGAAAIEMAKSEADLAKAASEFSEAAAYAPNMAAAWYNLGSVQAKIGQLKEAIKSYRTYLILAPKADDTQRIKDEIIKLEYRLEQAESFKGLSGYWVSQAGALYRVGADGGRLTLRGLHYGSDGAIDYVIGGKHSSNMGGTHCLVSTLTERGGKWVGSWEVPGITYPTACSVPTSLAEVEAQIDEAGGRITVKITRPKFRVEVVDPGIWSSKWACGGVSATGTVVEENLLMGPVPNGYLLLGVNSDGPRSMYISQVGPGEEKAGLKSGDHIVSIDGAEVAKMSSMGEARLKLYGKPGTVAQLVIKRKAKKSSPEETLNVSVPRTDISAAKISVCGE